MMPKLRRRSPSCVVANVLDCNIAVCKFKLQLHYYIYFWSNAPRERYEPFYPLSFYREDFGIE